MRRCICPPPSVKGLAPNGLPSCPELPVVASFLPPLPKPSPKPAPRPPQWPRTTKVPAKPAPPAASRLKALLKALWPRKLLRAVFKDQVRLRRKGSQLVFALSALDTRASKLDDQPAAAQPPSGAPAAETAATETAAAETATTETATTETAAAQMRRALGELLDTRPDSRKVLKHLAALERQLRKRPEPFMHEISRDSLRRMIRQLDGLIVPPPAAGAALLMAELRKALAAKEGDDEPPPLDLSAIAPLYTEWSVEVTELSTPDAVVVDDAPPDPATPPPQPPKP